MELIKKVRRWLESWHKWPFRHISKALYWLRTHTYNRYHMLDMRSPVNGYSWGYSDKSYLILFANMALLRDFIEKEKGFECHVDWRSAAEVAEARKDAWKLEGKASDYEEEDDWAAANRDAHAVARLEMLTIYDWWTRGRAAEHKKEDELLEAAYPNPFEFEPIPGSNMLRLKSDETPELRKLRDQCHDMETLLEEKDEEMLIRLIKVSGYMWT